MKRRVGSALAVLACIAPAALAGTLASVKASPVENSPQFVGGEATGPDGNVWFAAFNENAIGRLSTDGSIRYFKVPTANADPDQVTVGPDGNVWFTEAVGKVGRVTPEGVVTEFPVATSLDGPRTIVGGSDGNVWLIDMQFPHGGPQTNWKIDRVTPAGTVTKFDLGSTDQIETMATGPDGLLWLFNVTHNKVVTFSPTKGQVVASYAVSNPNGPFEGFVHHFAIGPDGNMWLTHDDSLIRIKPEGTMTAFKVPTAGSNPSGLVNGGDGSLWFTEYSAKKLGQLIVSTAGDSGQATINESDAVLSDGSADLVLLTGPTPKTGAATRVATNAIEFAPCSVHTAVAWHTVSGVWMAMTWPVGPNNNCADLQVEGWISTKEIDGSRRSEFASGKTLVECGADNDGPGTATGVTLVCNVFGASIVLGSAKINDKCTFTPSSKGVTVRADALTIGSACRFEAELAVSDDAQFGLMMNAWSNEVDPNPRNNVDSLYFTIAHGHAVIQNRIVPIPDPLQRGH